MRLFGVRTLVALGCTRAWSFLLAFLFFLVPSGLLSSLFWQLCVPPRQFQESRLENVTFVNCVFTNVDKSATAFTSVQMTNVAFAGGRFRNTNGQATVFNKLGTFAARGMRSMCM